MSLSYGKKCTGKLQMNRIGFSDKRLHRIKEWAETQHSSLDNCMSGLLVENAKNCTLLLVLLTPYINDIGYCYGKSYFIVSFV